MRIHVCFLVFWASISAGSGGGYLPRGSTRRGVGAGGFGQPGLLSGSAGATGYSYGNNQRYGGAIHSADAVISQVSRAGAITSVSISSNGAAGYGGVSDISRGGAYGSHGVGLGGYYGGAQGGSAHGRNDAFGIHGFGATAASGNVAHRGLSYGGYKASGGFGGYSTSDIYGASDYGATRYSGNNVAIVADFGASGYVASGSSNNGGKSAPAFVGLGSGSSSGAGAVSKAKFDYTINHGATTHGGASNRYDAVTASVGGVAGYNYGIGRRTRKYYKGS